MAMTLSRLRAFVAVAEAGSVRGAAESLVVSQPSVSAAVTALALEVGAPLLARDGRGVCLTAAGTAFLPRARDALGLLETGAREARAAGGAEPASLRIAAVTTAGEHLVAAALRTFRELYPDVRVSLEVGNRDSVVQRLVARAADVGIGGRPPDDGSLAGEPFAPNEHVVVVASDHPFAGRTASLLALAEEPWLVREPGSGTRAYAEEYLTAAGLHPDLTALGSNGALREAAAAGLGIAVVPLVAVRDALASGSLATVSVVPAPPARSWHVLLPRHGETQLARAFARVLHDA